MAPAAMKILYLANDRRGANAAAAALRGVVSDVVLTLVDRPEDARRWIDANRDFAALILDIDPQASERRALVHDLRSIGVTVPIIAACAGDPSVIRPFTGLADAIVTRDVTFGEQLSRAVRRLLMIEGPPPRRRLRLLYLGDDSLARECLGRPGGSIEVIADSDPDDRIESALLDGALTTAPCDLLLIEHGRPGVDTLAVLRGVAARYPGLPVVIVADWDEQLAVRALQLGASDYVLKSRASFRAVYFRLHRLIAQSVPVEEQTRLRGRRAAAIDRDSGNQDDLMRRVADAEAARQNADEQLTAAIAAVRQSRKDRLADAVAAARELAQRESRFAARLADALAEAQHLRERLSSQDMLLKQQEERAGRQHRALSELFARRQADADAALNNEVALRRTLERRLAEAEGSLQTSEEQRRAGQSAAAESLAQQHAEFTARLAQITTARETVERRLNEALAAIAEAQAGRAADAAAAAEHLARRESELAARISRAATEQEQLERRLIDADAALRCAEQRMAAELHAARLIATEREAEFDAERLVLVASHDAVKGQLADLRRALEDAEQRRAADRTEAERRLNEAQDRHHAALAEAAGRHDGLQQQLAAADAHLQRVLAGHASEIAEAGVRLATMQGAADARATQLVTAVASLERQLSDAVAALGRLEDQTAAEREAARLDAALRQRDFEAAIASEITNREAVERALTQSEADRQEAARAHASAIADAAARHTALEFDLTRKSGQLAALEATLAQSESTRDNEAQQHASAIAAAGARLADHQQQTDGWLADAAALADALDERRQLLEAALARSEDERARDRQSAREDAVQQQTEYEARLAEEVSLREAREAQLRETETALQEAERRHLEQMTAVAAESALHRKQADAQMAQLAAGAAAALEAAEQEGLRRQRTAADESAARERDLEAEIARHAAHGEALTRALADAEATRLRDDAQYASRLESAGEALAAAHREKDELMAQLAAARDHGDQLERLATEAQAAWQRLDADAQERILRLQDEGDALRSSLREAGEQLQQRDHAHQEERAGMERARLALEADLARGRAEYAALETALEQTRSAAEDTLAQLSTERAQERSTFEALVRERDAELRDRAARQQSSEERAAAALTALEHRLQLAAETHRVDAATIAQLQQSSAALTRNLEQVNRERDVLNLQADRVPELERQLNALHAQQRRQFVETPMSMCRCRPDGAVTHVNQALARLLGYATPDAVPTRDFGEAIFDSKDELPWLLNRCLASRATQSIETTWKKRDGRRIVVRVFALPVAAGAIDLVAEDVTRVRALEEQLRNAQRMEAVARYGSEVAATCGSLLRHVKQEGQEWLARVESDTTRYQGELLFHEVTRAAGFLEHFAAYGNEEKDAPVLVDVTTLLRDLAPVLRRVAGDNIELVVSQPHTPLNLDVEAKRVERMLINVAAYGRERMPFGGRLKIEVASVVVNREFVARYPNVRPGAHVLLTVSEVRAVPRRDLPDTVESAPAVAASQSRPADNPGVDLGTLQTLVSDCGGHLWMMAEPSGNMVLKIHVPRRVLDRAEPALQPVRSRWIHRAFGARH